MNTSRFIAHKIASSQSKSFTSSIVKIAIASTALSIAVMILSSAILEGFSREIRAKVYGFWSNIHVSDTNVTRNFDLKAIDISLDYYDQLKSVGPIEYRVVDDGNDEHEIFTKTNGGISHVQPFIIMAGVVETKSALQPILYKGIDDSFDWSAMKTNLVEGRSLDLSTESPEVVVSKNIANRLNLKVDQKILVSFIKNKSKIKRRVQIAGIYSTGLEEYDRRVILGPMTILQDILDWEDSEVSGIEIFVDDPEDSKIFSEYIYENILPLHMYCETIEEKFPNIFEWLKLLDLNGVVIYQLMIIVALINMITVILILVLERTKMIGILKSFGGSNWLIKKIFLYHAFYIILKGMFWGNVIGLSLAFLQKSFNIIKLDEESYYLDTAPIHLDWLNILLINIGTMAIILFALLLPLIIISRISPIKSLRFN